MSVGFTEYISTKKEFKTLTDTPFKQFHYLSQPITFTYELKKKIAHEQKNAEISFWKTTYRN